MGRSGARDSSLALFLQAGWRSHPPPSLALHLYFLRILNLGTRATGYQSLLRHTLFPSSVLDGSQRFFCIYPLFNETQTIQRFHSSGIRHLT